MGNKESIRKKYIFKRRKKYFNVSKNFFTPLAKLLKKKYANKKINISLYYPSFYELNVFKILDLDFFRKSNFSLPVIEKNNSMSFIKWKKNDILNINKYGIVEPLNLKKVIPNVVLLPLLAFDKNKNRLGYGKGFYDKYLNNQVKTYKNILAIGVAFSFQKHHNLPSNKKDYKLDYIITDKGIF